MDEFWICRKTILREETLFRVKKKRVVILIKKKKKKR